MVKRDFAVSGTVALFGVPRQPELTVLPFISYWISMLGSKKDRRFLGHHFKALLAVKSAYCLLVVCLQNLISSEFFSFYEARFKAF
jgi:hypothetical protein